jgi:hypothetical protein
MKYILMSFQPKWLALIMNGKKKVEVRTRIPECLKNGEPVTVLGYCAKSTGGRIAMNKPYLFMSSTDKNFLKQCGADIYCLSTLRPIRNVLNGLVCCKFVVEKVEEVTYDEDGYADKSVLWGACINQEDFDAYAGDRRPIYDLHITVLEIIKPMPLSAFKHEVNVWVPEYQAFTDELRPVTRAPQSWIYIAEPVEVGE